MSVSSGIIRALPTSPFEAKRFRYRQTRLARHAPPYGERRRPRSMGGHRDTDHSGVLKCLDDSRCLLRHMHEVARTNRHGVALGTHP